MSDQPTDTHIRPRSRLRKLVRLSALACLLGLTLAAAALAWLWPRCSGIACPSVEALQRHAPPQASLVFDHKGKLVARLAPEQRVVVPLGAMSQRVIDAFLTVEDRRFYEHDGVDWRRAAGALVSDVRHLSAREGFSTLTMQLARNVFPEHLSRQKTLRRKLWEMVLARDIERALSKQQILELYLNQIYLGDGLYGVEAAAQGYFGKSAKDLTAAQAATLAALPKAPVTYNPRRNAQAAKTRRDLVLTLMAEAKVLSAVEAAKAKAEPVKLAPPWEAAGQAPWFVAAVRKELRDQFGPDADTMGLRVHTGLDPALQQSAEREIVRQVEALEQGKLGKWKHPVCAGAQEPDPDSCVQGMFVALEPKTGLVRALVGGRDFALSQFDRALQARRQPGSAFKPILYGTALAQGIPISEPVTPQDETATGDYQPAEHDREAPVRNLREALRVSSNRAAVRLGEKVGIDNVVRTAQALGLSTPIPEYPSSYLGAAEVVPLELVAAYGAFANGGVRSQPHFIRKVEGPDGTLLWEPQVMQAQALTPQVAYLMLDLLSDVVNKGTGAAVRAQGLPATTPAAGKTGTTDNAQDVWFVGVTPDVAAGVWFGFDRPQPLTRSATGGSVAAPVWGRVVRDLTRLRPTAPGWVRPAGIVEADVDMESGGLSNTGCPPENVAHELFAAGTVPTEDCPLHASGVGGLLDRAVEGIGSWFR